jgi:(p)ppGpp synthase/HD superfamily hydrolase
MALFKTDKPKQFTYIPRFYDERKEELDSRIGEIKKEVEENQAGQYVPNIRGRMRSRHDALYGITEKGSKQLISRRLLTIVFVGMILLIGYYILRILAVAGKI